MMKIFLLFLFFVIFELLKKRSVHSINEVDIDGLTSLKSGAFRTGEETHMNLIWHK